MRLGTSRPLKLPDGLRPLSGETFLMAEGGGTLDRVSVDGDKVAIETLKDGLAEPTAVAKVGQTAWVASTNGEGVRGTSHGAVAGVAGFNDGPPKAAGQGVWGESQHWEGVHGNQPRRGGGVAGFNDAPHGAAQSGLWGESTNGEGVHGVTHSPSAAAITGIGAPGGLAGFFQGNVTCTGALAGPTITALQQQIAQIISWLNANYQPPILPPPTAPQLNSVWQNNTSSLNLVGGGFLPNSKVRADMVKADGTNRQSFTFHSDGNGGLSNQPIVVNVDVGVAYYVAATDLRADNQAWGGLLWSNAISFTPFPS